MNWHMVREKGVTLFGPDPRERIAPTSTADFVAAVRVHLAELPGRAERVDAAGFHSYTALTACRGLHACCEERQTSKAVAAEWAARRYPEWGDVIEAAVAFRAGRRSEPRLSEADGEVPTYIDLLRVTANTIAEGLEAGNE